MLYQIKSYINFILKATNAHGVHSPFVYNLVTRCFYDKTRYSQYPILKKHRLELLKSTETILVSDYGAGSRVFTSQLRQVSAIAKNAGIPRKRQQLLFRMAAYFQTNNILELGTSLGLGTMALSLGNLANTVTSVEGCPNTADKAKELFLKFRQENIILHQESFKDFFLNTLKKDIVFDLVYIDGNHNKLGTLTYFELLLDHIDNDSILIFDDIYWSKEMTEAWKEIIAHEKVTVSIDTFQWGLVFFRKEQRKEHFIIRL